MKHANNTLITITPVSSKRRQRQSCIQTAQKLVVHPLLASSPEEDRHQHKQKLKRQPHSLTFIADLASTSTPTRVSSQPIASTPKRSCHDPLKYHPTHTIRNKLAKKTSLKKKTASNKLHGHLHISRIETVKSLDAHAVKRHGPKPVDKRKMFASELNLDCLTYTAYNNAARHKKVRLAIGYRRDCVQVVKAVTNNHKNILVKNCHRVPKLQSAYNNNRSIVSSFSSINSGENCNICNEKGTRKEKPLPKKKKINQRRRTPVTSGIKFKAGTFEISLEDLLYAPAKLKKSIEIPRQQALGANNASKVYYL